MDEQNPTQGTHPGDESTPSSGGDEAVTDAGLSLEDINAITGRDYKDLTTARESLKEMHSMAGKAADLEGKLKAMEAVPKTDDELRAMVAELSQAVEANKTETFFSQHPEHAANRGLLEKIAKADGIDLVSASQSDEYQAILQAQQAAAQNQSKRTVAGSNNRVTQGKAPEVDIPAGDVTAAADYVAKNFFSN